MQIQHNLIADNSIRQSILNNKKVSDSQKKLSSGYRVNSAADDAATLTISEGMRAQIRGLEQGSRNLYDGIGVLNVGDGALGGVQDMLIRMRELSVQSANDINDGDDREAIQKEMNALTAEINRVAHHTELNGIFPLLGGSGSSSFAPDPSYASVLDCYTMGNNTQGGIFMYIPGMNDYAGAIGDYGNGGCAVVRLLNDDGTTTNLKLGSNTADGKGKYTIHGDTATYEYKDIDKGIHFIVEESCEIVTIQDETSMTGGQFFKPSYEIKNLGTNSFNYDMYLHLDPINGSMSAPPSKDDVSLSGTVGYTPASGDDLTIICNPASYSAYTNCDVTTIFSGDSITNPPDAVLAGSVFHDGQGNGNNYNIQDLYDIKNGTFTGAGGSQDYHFTAGWLDKNMDSGSSFKVDMMFGLSYPLQERVTSGAVKDQDFWIQSGANPKQGFRVPLCNCTTDNLDLRNMDMSSHISCNEAIAKVDHAFTMVNDFRSTFGAYQNLMERMILANDNTAENTQVAESRMRDTDMAQETVSFSKANIMQQVINSVMAQANQAPKNVLELLK